MSTKQNPAPRRRGAAAREEAVAAARDLVIEGGPSAMTLKAVGERMGVGHANLIHHFGSAAGLQGAVMDAMMRDLAERLGPELDMREPGVGAQRHMLDAVFEAFDGGGAAQVAAWLALARETERSESFAGVVRDLAERLARLGGGDPAARDKARRLVLIAAYMAFAAALIGPALKTMLDAPAAEPRDLALAAARGVIEGE